MSLSPNPNHDAEVAAPGGTATVPPGGRPTRPEQSGINDSFRRLTRAFAEMETNQDNITAELSEALPVLPFKELIEWFEIVSRIRPYFGELEVRLEKEIQRRLKAAFYGDLPARDIKNPVRGVEIQALLDSVGDRHEWLIIIPVTDLPAELDLKQLFTTPPGGGRPVDRDGRVIFKDGQVYVPLSEIRPFAEWVEEQTYRAEKIPGLENVADSINVSPEERITRIKEDYQFLVMSAEIQRLKGDAARHRERAYICLHTIGLPRSSEEEKKRAATEMPSIVTGLCDTVESVQRKMAKMQRGWDEIHQYVTADTRRLITDETTAFLSADRAAKECERLKADILRIIERVAQSLKGAQLAEIDQVIQAEGDEGFSRLWEEACGAALQATESTAGPQSGGVMSTLRALGQVKIQLGHPREEPPVVAPQLIALAQGRMPEGGYAAQSREDATQGGTQGMARSTLSARAVKEEAPVTPSAPLPVPARASRETLLQIPTNHEDEVRKGLIKKAAGHKVVQKSRLDAIDAEKGTLRAEVVKRPPLNIAQMIVSLKGPARANLIEDWGVILFDKLFEGSQAFIKCGALFLVGEDLFLRPEGEEEDLKWINEQMTEIIRGDHVKKGFLNIPVARLVEVVGRISQIKKPVPSEPPRLGRLRELIESV